MKRKIIVVGSSLEPRLQTLIDNHNNDIKVIITDKQKPPSYLLGPEPIPFMMQSIDNTMKMLYPNMTKKQWSQHIDRIRDSSKNPKINRNSPCPCGSGLKYKHCCLNKS